MKRWIGIPLVVVALSGVVLLPSRAGSAPPVARTAILSPTNQREPHPQIKRAIAALEVAKMRLQRAAHDFGGHRVAAIAAIDAALVQLKLALEYDKD